MIEPAAGAAGFLGTRARVGVGLPCGCLGAMKWTSAPLLGALAGLGFLGFPKRRLAHPPLVDEGLGKTSSAGPS